MILEMIVRLPSKNIVHLQWQPSPTISILSLLLWLPSQYCCSALAHPLYMPSQTTHDTAHKFNALGEKSIPKLLVQYSLPAIIAMVVSSLYNIIDGIFIGQAVGADAI